MPLGTFPTPKQNPLFSFPNKFGIPDVIFQSIVQQCEIQIQESGLTNPMTTLGDLIKGGVSGIPERLPVGTDGQILKSVSGDISWDSIPVLDSGTYTPTLFNTTNVTSSNSPFGIYSRVGNQVTFSVQALVFCSGAGNTVIEFSLPIASNFSASANLIGTAINSDGNGICFVDANTTNDRIRVSYNAAASATNPIQVTGIYTVI